MGAHVSNWLARLPAVRQKVCYSAHLYYGRVYQVIFDFSCLLIRSAARFAIRIEAFPHRPLPITAGVVRTTDLEGPNAEFWT